MVQKYPSSRFTSTSKPTTRRFWSRSTPTSSRTSTKSGATSTRSKTCTARFFRRFEPTTRSRPSGVWKTWSKKTSDSVDEFKRRWKLKSRKLMMDSNNSRKKGKALKSYLSKSEISFYEDRFKICCRGTFGSLRIYWRPKLLGKKFRTRLDFFKKVPRSGDEPGIFLIFCLFSLTNAAP